MVKNALIKFKDYILIIKYNMPLTEDYLETDPPIPGQNYVCVSFVSPENILRKKTIFEAQRFVKSLLERTKIQDENERLTTEQLLEKLTMDSYLDYSITHEEENNKIFNEENDFVTSIRGVKIRGVFESLKEAQRKAKVLQTRDPTFHIYVGQVGYWLPWDPNPDSVANQEYAEQALNELVHKYKENQEAKDEIWDKDIKKRIAKTKEEGQLGALEAASAAVTATPSIQEITENEVSVVDGGELKPEQSENMVKTIFEGEDVFLARKNAL
jgi:hypothetical protein